ncbi:MAG: choice-of-anchor J domain-containing protein, partial [Bacteroidia bacterium]
MKKFLIAALLYCSGTILQAQVLFSDRFNTLPLQTYTTSASVTNYTTVGTGYSVINDTLKNNPGNPNSPNRPFQVPAMSTTDWAVLYNAAENDTFLVSTSWIDTALAVSRFVVTPMVNNITSNTILSWDAKAPDPSFRDGYNVYVTNKTGTLTAADIAPSDLIFSIGDGNTAGGGELSTWTKRSVSLGMYAGQNLRFVFQNISNSMYQLWIDNITVQNLPNALDGELSQVVPTYKYNTVNTPGAVSCRVTNKGYSPITGVTLNYIITGFSNQTESFGTSAALPTYAVNDFTFTVPYSINTPGYYKMKLWISGINGSPDQNHSNDTLVNYLSIMSSAPFKNVMIEQFMSAADGYGADAEAKLDTAIQYLSTTASSVIAVNIHNNDSMAIPTAASLFSTYMKKNSTAMIDRVYYPAISSVPVERTTYTTLATPRQTAIVPVKVSIANKTYDPFTRALSFTVQADFVAEVKGDYRINAYVIENHVYGPPAHTATLTAPDTVSNGWNQLNYLYDTPWSPWFQTGSYSPADNAYVLIPSQYHHRWVLDAAPDGAFGLSGGPVPVNGGTSGQTYTKAYTYILPVSTSTSGFRYNIDNMYVVGFVAEYDPDKNQRNVLNCVREKATVVPEGIQNNATAVSDLFSVYPNPAN